MRKGLYLLLTLCLLSVTFAQETESDAVLAADVNSDGVINILDLTVIALHFGEILTEEMSPNPDINSDGVVNILDLTLAASHFGKYSGIPLKLTDETFDNVVLNANLPILVEFKSDY